MNSTFAQDSPYRYPPGFDTPSHPEIKDGVGSGPSTWHTPPPDALGRPYPLFHDSYDCTPTTNITTSFGGILDSPVVQIKPRSTAIPLSPPPSLPTTRVGLPPLNDYYSYSTTLDEPSKIERNDGRPGVERPRLHELPPAWPFESYSPPLSPVGTSPSFTSLALSFAPINDRGEGSLVSSASSTSPTSHEGAAIITSSPDPRVLLSPLSPEWDADFVDEDEQPLSIDAVLSGLGTGRAESAKANRRDDEDREGAAELDELGLADGEDGGDAFAFAGFLTRGSSRPRLSMLEIPPSIYPPTTLSPSSYYPSATSPTISSLWTVDATPTSPTSSSSTLWAGAREDDGGDDLKHQSAHHSSFTLGSSSPHTSNIGLFPSAYDGWNDTFDAYDSPQFQCTALPGLLSSPRVAFGDLPEDESTLLLSSDDHHLTLGRELTSPSALDLDSRHSAIHSTCHDREEANLSALLEKFREAERDARKREDEALEAIAAIRSPGSKSTRLSPRSELSKDDDDTATQRISSKSVSELQKIASDARRAAKHARSRAKEVSALLRIKAVDQHESSLFAMSSPSPPMLFESLDDTTPLSSPTPSNISPPLSSLQMDGFATSPPIFGPLNKTSSSKKSGDVNHLVAKMILNRHEAGGATSSSSTSSAANYAIAKPAFLSPLLGHHHQLQLRQRYKFLRSSPLARHVVTLPSPSTALSSIPTPSPLASSPLDGNPGPSRSNSLDSTCSTDTACSSSSSDWSEWDSDGETSLGEEDANDLRALRKEGGLLGSLDDGDEDADEDVEMGFQALKTPLMWGMDLGFDSGFDKRGEEDGEDGLLSAL